MCSPEKDTKREMLAAPVFVGKRKASLTERLAAHVCFTAGGREAAKISPEFVVGDSFVNNEDEVGTRVFNFNLIPVI